MSLLLTEIHCLDALSHSCIVFAADRRISIGGKYAGTHRKIFQAPYLRAGVGFFGLAEIHPGGIPVPMSIWLLLFIRRNSNITNLEEFANTLAGNLNLDVPSRLREQYVSGFHLAGYNSAGLPEFWFIRNVEDDRVTITGLYKAREDFLHRDAIALGYDGLNPRSLRAGQAYRNGDIRAHVLIWESIDEGLGNLLKEREFKKITSISDYENWVKFKLEIIAYFYKKYCLKSIVAKPIDTFLIEGRVA